MTRSGRPTTYPFDLLPPSSTGVLNPTPNAWPYILRVRLRYACSSSRANLMVESGLG